MTGSIAAVRSDIATDITEIQNTINDTTNTTINEKTKYLAVNSTGIPHSPRLISPIFRSLSGI